MVSPNFLLTVLLSAALRPKPESVKPVWIVFNCSSVAARPTVAKSELVVVLLVKPVTLPEVTLVEPTVNPLSVKVLEPTLTSLFFMLEDPTVKLPAEVKFTSGFRFTVRLFAVAANLMLPSVLLKSKVSSGAIFCAADATPPLFVDVNFQPLLAF